MVLSSPVASSAAISSKVNARRTSPSAAPAISRRASSPACKPCPPRPRSPSSTARRSACRMSSAETASMTCTRQRESNAELSSKEGFSVVAPTNRMVPRSMCGRNASCWPLLKRCTSSTNSTVRRPSAKRCAASASTARTSGNPDSTAEMAWNSASAYCASNSARVVLPQPGGPHRIIECTRPDSTARRSALPGASSLRCPTISSRVRGRMRSASGRIAERSTLSRSVSCGNGFRVLGDLATGQFYRPWRPCSAGAGPPKRKGRIPREPGPPMSSPGRSLRNRRPHPRRGPART